MYWFEDVNAFVVATDGLGLKALIAAPGFFLWKWHILHASIFGRYTRRGHEKPGMGKQRHYTACGCGSPSSPSR